MPRQSLGYCGECQERVNADYRIEDEHVWFRKSCPDCGENESLVSSDGVVIIPLEEQHSIDSQRLKTCQVGSVYENVATGKIEVIPHCTWYPYRNPILRKIANKYGNTRTLRRAA